tara:strand:- start:7343 stop:7780 length:438 start_codon:yes stop_codon:yes gene_type:complete
VTQNIQSKSEENNPSELEGNETVDNPINEKLLDLNALSSENSDLNRFECKGCGFIYDPAEGIRKFGIHKNTPFNSIDKNSFKCPVCRSGYELYENIGLKNKSGGFEENLTYGFGFNKLPPAQKNVLIFGGLAFAAACFLSLYSLH